MAKEENRKVNNAEETTKREVSEKELEKVVGGKGSRKLSYRSMKR